MTASPIQALILALRLLPESAAAEPVEQILAEAAATCADFGGSFNAGEGVVTVGLDGKAPLDRLADAVRFTCR